MQQQQECSIGALDCGPFSTENVWSVCSLFSSNIYQQVHWCFNPSLMWPLPRLADHWDTPRMVTPTSSSDRLALCMDFQQAAKVWDSLAFAFYISPAKQYFSWSLVVHTRSNASSALSFQPGFDTLQLLEPKKPVKNTIRIASWVMVSTRGAAIVLFQRVSFISGVAFFVIYIKAPAEGP